MRSLQDTWKEPDIHNLVLLGVSKRPWELWERPHSRLVVCIGDNLLTQTVKEPVKGDALLVLTFADRRLAWMSKECLGKLNASRRKKKGQVTWKEHTDTV